MVAIDGCSVQCAAKTLQHAEIEPAIQVIVTDLESRSLMRLHLTKRPAQKL